MTFSYIKVTIPLSWTSGEVEHCIEREKLLISESLEKQRKGTDHGGRERRRKTRGEGYPNHALAPNSPFSNEFL